MFLQSLDLECKTCEMPGRWQNTDWNTTTSLHSHFLQVELRLTVGWQWARQVARHPCPWVPSSQSAPPQPQPVGCRSSIWRCEERNPSLSSLPTSCVQALSSPSAEHWAPARCDPCRPRPAHSYLSVCIFIWSRARCEVYRVQLGWGGTLPQVYRQSWPGARTGRTSHSFSQSDSQSVSHETSRWSSCETKADYQPVTARDN